MLKKPNCCSLEGVDDRRDRMCVCDLEHYRALVQSTVTYHLKVLRRAGLAECRKVGPWLYYRRNEAALKGLGVAVANL